MPEPELSIGRYPSLRPGARLWSRLRTPIMGPIRAFRFAYLPPPAPSVSSLSPTPSG